MARAALALLALVLAHAGCLSDDRRAIEREVEVLIGEPGRASAAAEDLLVARGRSAILYLESGLYGADADGRLRIVRVLDAIDDPEALPIVRHLEARDPSADVRRAAGAARGRLESGPRAAE